MAILCLWVFCGQSKLISAISFTQYTILQNMGSKKSIHTITSRAPFFKGNCVMHVDGIIYCRTIAFWGDVSFGSRRLANNYRTLVAAREYEQMQRKGKGLLNWSLPFSQTTKFIPCKRAFGCIELFLLFYLMWTYINVIFPWITYSSVRGNPRIVHLNRRKSRKSILCSEKLRILQFLGAISERFSCYHLISDRKYFKNVASLIYAKF